jgi:2-keto-4-pentenoate hydratase
MRHARDDLDDAYAVQAAFARKRAGGAHRIGWKIGLTSRAMQDALGIDTPDSGMLLDDMAFEREHRAAGRFIQPRIEAEIAFVLKSDLSGGISAGPRCSRPRTMSRRRSKSSTPASCAPTRKPGRAHRDRHRLGQRRQCGARAGRRAP